MKKALPAALAILMLFLSSCGSPTAEVTPTPEPTPTEVVTPTPAPTETPAPGTLTEEELRWFEEEFFKSGFDNIRNVFGCPYNNIYAKPQDINLIELFYDGSHMGNPIKATETEINTLLEQGAFSAERSESGDVGYICPVFRVTCEEMNEVLLKYTGLTLEETNKVGLEYLPYLEEYDAYYWCHGDVGYPGPLTILSGIREGSIVRLYQEGIDPEGWKDVLYCLTLEQQPEGNYWFVSNVPVDETASVKLPTSTGSDELESPQGTDEKGENAVTLVVHGTAYFLSDEHGAIIYNLFYSHEKEKLDSPLESMVSLHFHIGEDFLATSMEVLQILHGWVDGEHIMVTLNEDEQESLHQIISTYVENLDEVL